MPSHRPSPARRGFLLASTAVCLAAPAQAQTANPWATPEYYASQALRQINAAAAYAQGYTGAGVTVGVMDAAVDGRHPEFSGRMVAGWDFLNNRPTGQFDNMPDDSHGTHVAGIIAAARNGEVMQGVAFNARIMSVAYNWRVTSEDEIFASSWNYLAASGVPIVNNSVGMNDCDRAPAGPCNVTSYTRAKVEAELPQTLAAMRATARAGVLMVFATGNETQPHPDVLAGMPYLVPELKDTWLAVNLVSSVDLAVSWGNRCGVAKDWCLVAPGYNILSTVPLGEGFGLYRGYDTMSGTSMAAPSVSGAAALVKEAFPWFTAHDIQQAILTTATDLGEPGVDNVYGWGMLNVGKAVLGYAMFTGTTTLDTQGMTSTFSQDISGAGTLIKTGTGELILTGANTYSGGSWVDGGTLSINGSVASNVYVGQEGLLRGTGQIFAQLAVAGRLAPGNSPGTLTVAGPVLMSPTATFQVDIDGTGTGTGAGNYSRLVTTGPTGTVEVAGTLAPQLRGITGSATNSYTPTLGTTLRVIEASAGVYGSFSGLAQPVGLAAGTRFDALYGANDLSLIVTPSAYGTLSVLGLATSRNGTAVGGALDSVRPAAGVALTGSLGAFYQSLYTLNAAALPATLAQLSGEAHASAEAMAFDDARHIRSAVLERLDGSGVAAAPLAPGLTASVWLSGYGGWAHASGGDAAALSWDASGFVAGIDAPVTEMVRFGLAAGFGQSSGTVGDLTSNIDNTHIDLAAYAVAEGAGWRAKAGVAYGWNDLSMTRAIGFGNVAEGLATKQDGRTVQAFGEISRDLVLGHAQVSPYASLAYVNQRLDAFAETGGVAALSGSAQTLSTTLATLGARLAIGLPMGNATVTPNVNLGWQHAFGDVATEAVMTLAGSSPFRVYGVPLARDALVLGGGLTYGFGNSVAASVAYDGLIGSDVTESSIKADLRFKF